MPTALLLDLDGTLVDSEPIHRAAYRSFFASRGWPHDEAVLGLFTGRRADDVFANEPGPWTGEEPATLHAAVMAHVDPDVSPEPVPGGGDLARAAVAAGVPLGIVTSAGPEWVEVTVDRLLGIHSHFDVVVTRDDVTDGKPDPSGYRLACRRLDAQPSGAVAVEDSPAGVHAAVAAGIGRVYGVTTTWPANVLREAGATAAVRDLTPLVALFDGP
jgi:sugar-phosphatase